MAKGNPFSTFIVTYALGFCFGFLTIIQVAVLVNFGQLSWVEGVGEGFRAYVAEIACLFAGGAVLGFAQTRVLGDFSVPTGMWVLATAIGFAALAMITLPLLYLGIWGNIPGPVEPLVTIVGGGSLVGIAQFILLRRLNVNANKWLAFWIAGLCLSVIPIAAVFMLLGGPLEVSISWPVEIAIMGLLAGGVAALVSGKTLLRSLPKISQ